MNLKRYQSARCKVDKTLVVIGIVNSIRRSSPLGGFIKKCLKTGRWISMSDEAAREKVGHCLRDMIASQRDDQHSGKVPKATSEEVKAPQSQQVQMDVLANAARIHGRTGYIPTSFTNASPSLVKKAAAPKSKAMMKKAKKASSALPPRKSTKQRLPAHFQPPVSVPQIPQQISSTFNNFDYLTMVKGNNQEMSLQQRRILKRLESGFKGTVEELLEAVRSESGPHSLENNGAYIPR